MSANTGFIPSLSNVSAGATAAQKKRDDASKDIFNEFSLQLQQLFDLNETAPQAQRDNLLLNLTGALKQINESGTDSEVFKAVGSAPQVASSPASAPAPAQQQSSASANPTAEAALLTEFENDFTGFVLGEFKTTVISKDGKPDVAATLNNIKTNHERKLAEVERKLSESVPKADVQAKAKAIVDATVDGTGDKKLLNREDTNTVRETAKELLDLSKPKPAKP